MNKEEARHTEPAATSADRTKEDIHLALNLIVLGAILFQTLLRALRIRKHTNKRRGANSD